MADVDLTAFCIEVHKGKQLCVTFPGGTTICAQMGIELGDPNTVIRSLMAQINSALAPMQPFFNVIDVLVAIVECVKAVPEALSLPPDPTKIFQCIPGLLEALEKLIGIPLQIPKMVKQIIQGVVEMMLAIIGEITTFIDYEADLLNAATKAAEPGNFLLKSIWDCETANYQAELQNLNESIKPLNRLIGIANLFVFALTGQELPTFQDLGESAKDAIAPLTAALNTISTIASYIPG